MRRRLGRAGLILALCASIAACGSSGASSTSTASTAAAGAGSGSTNAARLLPARVAAAKCIRAQGINIPDPTATRGSVLRMLSVLAGYPKVKVQSAEQACMAEIRQAFPNATSLTPAQRTQRLREAEVLAQCMRSHGVPSFPDPSAYAGNLLGYYKAISSVEANSPAYKAALPTCRAQALNGAGGG
jgi:hypothetical protein